MQTSPLLPLHEAAGARLQTQDSGEVRVLTQGDVPSEYRAGTEGCLLLDATTRGAVSVTGEEATAFLHRLLANDLKGLAPGDGNRNLLLSAKGKVLFDFDLAPTPGGGYLLSTPPGTGPGLVQALDMYLFADAVELEDRTEDHAPLEVTGPRAGAVLEKVLGDAPPALDHQAAEMGGVTVTRLSVGGAPGWRLDGGPGRAIELWKALLEAGATAGGVVAEDILRVEAGGARFGQDIDENIYPQEARMDDAFSLTKGCYIGQEVVAKIDTYGGLNKQLQVLVVDHDDPVAPGTRLLREIDGEVRDLGVVTSWAYSFVKDTGLVLAYVKRKHQDVGTRFQLDGAGEGEIAEWPIRPGTGPIP